jgi:hypothetical protein
MRRVVETFVTNYPDTLEAHKVFLNALKELKQTVPQGAIQAQWDKFIDGIIGRFGRNTFDNFKNLKPQLGEKIAEKVSSLLERQLFEWMKEEIVELIKNMKIHETFSGKQVAQLLGKRFKAVFNDVEGYKPDNRVMRAARTDAIKELNASGYGIWRTIGTSYVLAKKPDGRGTLAKGLQTAAVAIPLAFLMARSAGELPAGWDIVS